MHQFPAKARRITRPVSSAFLGALAAFFVMTAPSGAQEPISGDAAAAAWDEAGVAGEALPPVNSAAAAECPARKVEQPFAPFGDDRNYVLAPDSAFESAPAGWALRGAGVVAGNEPWYVHDPGDSSSLRIPSGTTVTSAPMCVDLDYPTFRLFARERFIAPNSTLAVEVVYADAEGSPSQAVGKLAGEGGWEVTPDIALLPELGGAEPGARLVRFQFTALGGSYRIDDLYVDPRNRH